MVTKKYLLLTGLCAALAVPALAQDNSGGTMNSGRDMTYRGESYDVLDSNYVPGKRMDQHRQFLNNQYNFPAKPRNMVEVGIHGGNYIVSGDVPSLNLWQGGGYGFGAHVRKAFGYIMSARLDYTYGIAKGLGFQGATNYSRNTAWNQRYQASVFASGIAGQPIFYNYKTEAHQLSLDLVATTNNIRFHRSKSGLSFYGFAGIAAQAYQTWINTTRDNTTTYQDLYTAIYNQYATNGGITYKERKDVKDALEDGLNGIKGMDDSYETAGQSRSNARRPSVFNGKTLNPAATFGLGVAVRLTSRINIAAETRFTTILGTEEDLMDGQKWSENPSGLPTETPNKDNINYTSLGLNFNLGGGGKNVEPLYWLNPLDFTYGELTNPRRMVLPEPVLVDSDGDGIADQFDKCPGTPAGVAVDSHGCPMDTDGDGVPDDRDKQLITPTECQPVDADGIGKCPCPADCPDGGGHRTCMNIMSGSIMFASNTARITPSMHAQLATLAAQMQSEPSCRVVVMGNGGDSKVRMQRSWDRVNAVIEYMTERHNIDRSRFIFQYMGNGSVPENGVMYRSAAPGEEGPSNIQPPHPNLRKD